MTIKSQVRCDGLGCTDELEVEQWDYPESDLRFADWHEDPDDPSQHYCPRCWDKVKQEEEK
jgi:hypothetical protein